MGCNVPLSILSVNKLHSLSGKQLILNNIPIFFSLYSASVCPQMTPHHATQCLATRHPIVILEKKQTAQWTVHLYFHIGILANWHGTWCYLVSTIYIKGGNYVDITFKWHVDSKITQGLKLCIMKSLYNFLLLYDVHVNNLYGVIYQMCSLVSVANLT